MSDPHETRASLLVRIRDQRDGAAWSQFVEIYSPLIYGFGRKHGLQDADAVDLTQEVLRIVARTAERFEYDAKLGSFRGWLSPTRRGIRLSSPNRSSRSTPTKTQGRLTFSTSGPRASTVLTATR